MHPPTDRPETPTFLHPALALVAVKDNESSDENDVHDHHDDHGGDDGAVGTANVLRIASIFHWKREKRDLKIPA